LGLGPKSSWATGNAALLALLPIVHLLPPSHSAPQPEANEEEDAAGKKQRNQIINTPGRRKGHGQTGTDGDERRPRDQPANGYSTSLPASHSAPLHPAPTTDYAAGSADSVSPCSPPALNALDTLGKTGE